MGLTDRMEWRRRIESVGVEMIHSGEVMMAESMVVKIMATSRVRALRLRNRTERSEHERESAVDTGGGNV